MRTTLVGYSPEWPTPLTHATDTLRWIAEAPHGRPTVTVHLAIHRSPTWGLAARLAVRDAHATPRNSYCSLLARSPRN
jgi:hypothetical protein